MTYASLVTTTAEQHQQHAAEGHHAELITFHKADGTPPAPPITSSIRPKNHHALIKGLLCLIGLFACTFLLYFLAMCLLLHFTNVPAVHNACPGLWDFVLYAFVFPMVSPVLYLFLQWSASFSTLTTGCSFGLSLLGLVISLQASALPECRMHLAAITPPVPWLLFVAWMKTSFFMCTLAMVIKPRH